MLAGVNTRTVVRRVQAGSDRACGIFWGQRSTPDVEVEFAPARAGADTSRVRMANVRAARGATEAVHRGWRSTTTDRRRVSIH